MKNIKRAIISSLLISIFLFSTKSFSQLNGTYIVGTGGDYATVTAAASALMTQGVNGPVFFKIKTGTYTETINLDSIVGSNAINVVTFESLSGNRNDVLFNNGFNNIFNINKQIFLY